MDASNLLGDFLRSRRQRVAPAEVGLGGLGARRVPGLRREEVALLAGISADYYLRLEQGRDRHPSQQVVEALARVLRLDAAASAHLLALAEGSSDRAGMTGRDVPDSIRKLLGALTLPAFVEDEHFDVLASNAAARAFSAAIVPGRNRLLTVFLDPDQRHFFPDWEVIAAELVAGFRATVAARADDARTVELVGELSEREGRFRDLWASQDVEELVGRPPVRVEHPVVGELNLTRDNLAVDGRGGLRLVIYHAEPGTDTAARLARLTAHD